MVVFYFCVSGRATIVAILLSRNVVVVINRAIYTLFQLSMVLRTLPSMAKGCSGWPLVQTDGAPSPPVTNSRENPTQAPAQRHDGERPVKPVFALSIDGIVVESSPMVWWYDGWDLGFMNIGLMRSMFRDDEDNDGGTCGGGGGL
ncbi:hypothetical protein R6Q59_024350 [Mikania micrantha]